MVEPLPSRGERRKIRPPSPVEARNPLGEDIMRSNSSKDESRNNLRDPTMRDRSMKRGRTSTGRKLKAPADHRQGRKD
jgi:hypothetical protein